MARPLRVDIEGGWYHVTARGDHRQYIFLDDRDHGHFAELLEEIRERFRVGVMAYVCMGDGSVCKNGWDPFEIRSGNG